MLLLLMASFMVIFYSSLSWQYSLFFSASLAGVFLVPRVNVPDLCRCFLGGGYVICNKNDGIRL